MTEFMSMNWIWVLTISKEQDALFESKYYARWIIPYYFWRNIYNLVILESIEWEKFISSEMTYYIFFQIHLRKIFVRTQTNKNNRVSGEYTFIRLYIKILL